MGPPHGAPARPQFHGRCRGSRPARAYLDLFAARACGRVAAGWDQFGLAVQAYQKRAPPVIDWLGETGTALGRRIPVRLVRAPIGTPRSSGAGAGPGRLSRIHPQGHDRSLLRRLYAQAPRPRERLYPQFATHNALTVAERHRGCGRLEGYEFHACTAWARSSTAPATDSSCRGRSVYAPVGTIVISLLSRAAPPITARIHPLSRLQPTLLSQSPPSWNGRKTALGKRRGRGTPKSHCRVIFMPLASQLPGVEFGDAASLAGLRTRFGGEDAGGSRPDHRR